jgi:hypothetical protein
MDQQLMFEQLEGLAKALDIEVRLETVRKEARFNPGGLCRIKGAPVIIINRKANLDQKIEVLGAAIKRFDLSGVYLRPGLRDFLEDISPGNTLEEDEVAWADEDPPSED